MPSNKKKNQINGFYIFMTELRPLLEREGRTFPNGMKDVVPVANPRWNMLSPAERKQYDERAKAQRRLQGATLEGKYTSDGRLIADVKKAESNAKNMQRNMEVSITNWIARLPSKEEAAKEKFYFISFNIACEVLVEDSFDNEVEFWPNEVGIVEYSIADGITRFYHKFIDPGQLPTGYAYAAMQHMEETHKIPIGFEHADANYVGTWIQMKNFINQDGMKNIYPPFFAASDQIKQTKGCIEWLYERSHEGYKNMLRVYNLDNLLLELRAKAGHALASYSEAKDLLTKNLFDYITDHGCAWHQEQDCVDCSLGVSKRLGYLMSDSLCHIYDVDLTPNHVPELSDSSQAFTTGYDENAGWNAAAQRDWSSRNSSAMSGACASGFSQDFPSISQSCSQSTSTCYSNIDEIEENLSQTTIDDLSQDNCGDSEWVTIGRGASHKRNTQGQQQQPVRKPGASSSTKFGIGRALMKHPRQ